MSSAHDVVVWLLAVLAWPTLGYFVVSNTSYLGLLIAAAADIDRSRRHRRPLDLDDIAASPLTPPISVVMSAYNEAAGAVSSVMAMLGLRYPEHEIVVVDDGSTDDMFERLREAFRLVEVDRVIPPLLTTAEQPTSVYVPTDGFTPLVVIRKANSGRADSLNVGVNAARYPLVAFVDSDSLLDPDALLVAAQPFCQDPDRVVAAGGAIRAVNGCTVRAGRVVDVAMPRPWLARIQVMEYLRAFTIGRAGWSRLGALIVISGAFGIYRRDVVVRVGGLDKDCIGEDMELVVRMHRRLREDDRDYRIVYLAEPTMWTEVPSSLAVLGRQRRRWSRGLWEVLWKHRAMTLNPRYGRIGLVALPYFWLFELAAPLVELFGLVVVPLGLLTQAIAGWTVPVLFMLVAYGYAAVVTLAAMLIEEVYFHRDERWRDLGLGLAAGVVENLGFRQVHAWWRLRGLVQGIRGQQREWGVMTRAGFSEQTPAGGPP